jgi:hypothetical protein
MSCVDKYSHLPQLDLHHAHDLPAEPVSPVYVVGKAVQRIAMDQCGDYWVLTEDTVPATREPTVKNLRCIAVADFGWRYPPVEVVRKGEPVDQCTRYL